MVMVCLSGQGPGSAHEVDSEGLHNLANPIKEIVPDRAKHERAGKKISVFGHADRGHISIHISRHQHNPAACFSLIPHF
jgi:malic enzyme